MLGALPGRTFWNQRKGHLKSRALTLKLRFLANIKEDGQLSRFLVKAHELIKNWYTTQGHVWILGSQKSPHSHSIAVGPCKKEGMEVGGGRPKHFQGALSALVYVYINAYGYITIKVSNYRHLKTRPNESPSSLSLFIFSLLSKILFNDHVKILFPPSIYTECKM